MPVPVALKEGGFKFFATSRGRAVHTELVVVASKLWQPSGPPTPMLVFRPLPVTVTVAGPPGGPPGPW